MRESIYIRSSCFYGDNLTMSTLSSTGSSDGGLSGRKWLTLVTGVAITSSIVTTLGILGVQRLYRQQRRGDLEERVRRAAKIADEEADRYIGDNGSSEKASGQKLQPPERSSTPKLASSLSGLEEHLRAATTPSRAEGATPRYLQAFNASQANTPSRSASPRPAPHASVIRQGSLPVRPSSRGSMRAGTAGAPSAPPAMPFDESLIREQLSRNYSFLGEEAMDKIRDAFVIVVGAGGVGSWTALMLLRSGVGKLRLIDFDQVSLSSLNRHACANLADVGRPKVIVCKEKFAEIAPWAEVDARVEIFKAQDASRLLGSTSTLGSPSEEQQQQQQKPTYVIDAIDNIDTKVDLLEYCYRNRIKCFSSMGAGAKADPSMVQVADLAGTTEDPLARSVRRGLRMRGVWGPGLPVRQKRGKRSTKSKGTLAPPKKTEEEKDGKIKDSKSPSEEEEETKTSAEAIRTTKRLEHSGRGAADVSGTATEQTPRHPSTGALAKVDDALKDLQSQGQSGTGYSSYSRPGTFHSRRTSSASSRGSGSSQFFSPMSSPEVEKFAVKEEEPPMSLDVPEISVERKSNEGESKEAQLQEEEDGDKTISLSRDETDEEQQKRPSLSTLTSQASSANASRTPSLRELEAVDMRSSRSGRSARPSISGQAASSRLGPALETEESADDNVSAGADGDEVEVEEEPLPQIMCVFSTEKSDTRLLPLDEEEFKKGNVEELAALEDFRVRILPVLGPLPAMFGLAAATYLLCDMAGKGQEPLPFKKRKKTYERFWADLEAAERRYPVADGVNEGLKDLADKANGPRRIPWTVDDVGYLFEEVFRARSVVPPHETLTMGKMCRWDSTLPLSYGNVALFTRAEGDKHEKEVLKGGKSPVEVWGEDAYRMWKRRMAEEARMNMLR